MAELTKQVRWTQAKEANICDECSDPIWPRDEIAVWIEVYFSQSTSLDSSGTRRQIKRHYCKPCGRLLEDSLTTTEAVS